MRGAGGTSGGLGEFLMGMGLIVVGGYLLLKQIIVSSGGWSLWGYDAFGMSLIPFLLGLGLVFYNGKSMIGWRSRSCRRAWPGRRPGRACRARSHAVHRTAEKLTSACRQIANPEPRRGHGESLG